MESYGEIIKLPVPNGRSIFTHVVLADGPEHKILVSLRSSNAVSVKHFGTIPYDLQRMISHNNNEYRHHMFSSRNKKKNISHNLNILHT